MEMPNPPEGEAETSKKPSYNKVYTPEEKAEILAFAREAGAVEAARKFNVSTTSIRNWTRQQSATQPPQGQLPFQAQEQTQLAQSANQLQEQIVQPSAHEEVVIEQGKKTVHGEEAVQQSDPAIEALLPEDPRVRTLVARVQELNMENAILKKKNAVLTRRIEALKASLMNLLGE